MGDLIRIGPPEERRPFFTPRTLAQYLALGETTVREMIGRREIPSYRIGGSRRIDATELDAWLATRKDAEA